MLTPPPPHPHAPPAAQTHTCAPRYPGATGATSVAETVFGLQNRFGKLPFTAYTYAFTQVSEFTNMNMTDYPGRSYKCTQPSPPKSHMDALIARRALLHDSSNHHVMLYQIIRHHGTSCPYDTSQHNTTQHNTTQHNTQHNTPKRAALIA